MQCPHWINSYLSELFTMYHYVISVDSWEGKKAPCWVGIIRVKYIDICIYSSDIRENNKKKHPNINEIID